MRTIQMQVAITLSEDAESAVRAMFQMGLQDIMIRAISAPPQLSAGVERSRNALFRGNPPPPPFLIDVRDVAKLLKLSTRTIAKMSQTGRMPPPTRIGAAVRWNEKELRAWVDAGCPGVDAWKWINDTR